MKTMALACRFRDQEKMRQAFHRHLRTAPASDVPRKLMFMRYAAFGRCGF
jgi:transcriptional regulator GlxA family with amidase domain